MADLITAPELARLLGISERRVHQCVQAGHIPKHGRGRFDLHEAVPAYCEFLRTHANKQADLNQEQARLARARADAQEMQNATRRGELLDAATCEREWSRVLVIARTNMMAVPRKAAPMVVGMANLAEIEAHLDAAIRDGLTRAFEEGERALTGQEN